MSKQEYQRSYPWAVNPMKLREAIIDLEDAKKANPSVVIDEASIKARYIVRKGLVKEVEAPAEAETAPDRNQENAEESSIEKKPKASKKPKA